VTTHWRQAKLLAQLYPQLVVEPDRIHIRDGNIWTSAGITAGIDLSLALIAQDHGEDIARAVAQEMVVYYRRPGGQSQFSALARIGGDAAQFAPLLDWIRAHLDQYLTIDKLAAQAAMSPRNFSRAFTREMGMSPAKAVERLRLEVARERVENTAMPIEQIAATLGFHDPERMRRAFLRAFGQPPQAMRRLARQASSILRGNEATAQQALNPNKRTPRQNRSPAQGQGRRQMRDKIGHRHFRRVTKSQQTKGHKGNPCTRDRQRTFWFQ
jgi:transcriptional regulator GlxA family with amidase domain